jgi:glycosyltransferase involved in cell wall biosynthesis
MRDSRICFAANATAAEGGQGEFLRQMVYALDQLPQGRILSRRARGARAECVDLPLRGWRRLCLRAIQRTPVLRRRHDLLTLLGDIDFDSQLGPHVADVNLFDGVMGQCCRTFELLNRKRVPLVLTALNTHIDHLGDALAEEHRRLKIRSRTFVHPQMRQRVRREIERASCIRVVSEQAKQSYVERGVKPEKIEVLLPAVDLDHFHPVEKKDATFRVLAVLSIDSRKGVYYLLQAFEKAAIPDSELVIIGGTGDRWSRQMVQHFMGRLKNFRVRVADVFREPIEATYGQASVLVHPAIEDGFALVVAQAMACGKPVIATRQTGASQLITNAENGYVLECRDIDGLVEYLRLLARDESLLARFSAAAPKAVAHLGYPAFANNIAQLYCRVLAN